MMELKELIRFLDMLFAVSGRGIVDFAPNGLQVEGKKEVGKLATAVTANAATIEAAIEQEVDALIVHHGLFWQKDSYVIQGSKRKKLSLLLEEEISLFAYHLPLDLHPEVGNNWVAAKEMGWENLQPFGLFNGFPLGVKGTIPALPREIFKKKLETYYEHSAACAWGGVENIHTVALVSGGAHKTLLEASNEGIDAFITGSFDEPSWYQAQEESINFLAMGHSATERVGPRALSKFLENALKIPCTFIDIFNPF